MNNNIRKLLQSLGIATTLFAATSFLSAVEPTSETPVVVDSLIQENEEMRLFLEKFPQFLACTREEQAHGLAFYKQAEQVKMLIREANQAVTDEDRAAAEKKVNEANEVLAMMSQAVQQ
jgi:hypothetical protein